VMVASMTKVSFWPDGSTNFHVRLISWLDKSLLASP
jgi:hypothetical protein